MFLYDFVSGHGTGGVVVIAAFPGWDILFLYSIRYGVFIARGFALFYIMVTGRRRIDVETGDVSDAERIFDNRPGIGAAGNDIISRCSGTNPRGRAAELVRKGRIIKIERGGKRKYYEVRVSGI